MQKILKFHCGNPEENASKTDEQRDGQVNRTNFIGPLQQRLSFHHVIWNFENKMFLDYFA